MVDHYYSGGGTSQEISAAKLFLAAFLGGFPEGTTFVDITDGGHVQDHDPYIKFCGAGGAAEIEFGLYNDYRIKITTTDIQLWDEGNSTWINLVSILNDHEDRITALEEA